MSLRQLKPRSAMSVQSACPKSRATCSNKCATISHCPCSHSSWPGITFQAKGKTRACCSSSFWRQIENQRDLFATPEGQDLRQKLLPDYLDLHALIREKPLQAPLNTGNF